MLRAGELRDRVIVRLRVDVPDAATGGVTASYTVLSQPWARVLPLAAGAPELREGAQITERPTHEVLLRHDRRITSAHEIVYDGIVLRVRSVQHAQMRDSTTCMCEQLDAPG